MDIDELLVTVTAHLCGARSRFVLREVIEGAIQRRLGAEWVAIRPSTDAEGPSPPVGIAPPAFRIRIPVRPGSRRMELFAQMPSGRVLTLPEHRYLERAGRVCAMAVEADPRRFISSGDDEQVRDGAAPLVGRTAVMRDLRERIERVAATDFTVLVEGESGTGKELVARHVHELSRRRRGPFVAVNCAAIVESLLEAELFGIEDRTATGVRGRRGKFEQASGGTLFLDEVADLSPSAQAKLLRAIQDFTVEPVGGHQPRRVDLRLVVATNKRLRTLVDRGEFRADLYFRLGGVELRVPPLRLRREDVVELARYFLERHHHVRRLDLSTQAAEALAAYDWPGNVRELERLIESLLTMTAGDAITLDDLPPAFRGTYVDVLHQSLQQKESLREWGRRYVKLMFLRCGENKRETCRVLDISYHTLQSYLRHPARRPRRARLAEPVQAISPVVCSVHERAEYGVSPDDIIVG